jgi:hypothetical protein
LTLGTEIRGSFMNNIVIYSTKPLPELQASLCDIDEYDVKTISIDQITGSDDNSISLAEKIEDESQKQAFDSYGNLYNDAFVKREGQIVNTYGTIIEGAYVDEKGHVIDGYGNTMMDADGNVISVNSSSGIEEEEEDIDPTAENPDIAAPPDEMSGAADRDATTWAGVTDEDLAEEG